MAKKTSLEQAVKKQADTLEPAQREFVMAEYETYKWNASKIAQLEKQLDEGVIRENGTHDLDAEAKLFRQRHQLVAEQSSLFSHIMRWLKGTTATESELDQFISG